MGEAHGPSSWAVASLPDHDRSEKHMGWERTKYEAICASCGKRGFCIRASDDWSRSSTTWIGFKNHAPSPTAVGRKRSDARDSDPRCGCGSTEINIGEMLGDCDSNGELFRRS